MIIDRQLQVALRHFPPVFFLAKKKGSAYICFSTAFRTAIPTLKWLSSLDLICVVILFKNALEDSCCCFRSTSSYTRRERREAASLLRPFLTHAFPMEFGGTTVLGRGGAVGLSWASPAPGEVANFVITTTESRVSVHAPDGRLVHSWLTRPGSYNRFTVSAVQNRVTRRFFCIQNEDRLFSWYEGDASLETASRTKLRGRVFALRTVHEVPLVIVVFTDGAVSAFDDDLKEVVHIPAPGDGSSTTWTRFARMPGDDSRYLLLTLQQHVPDQPPYICVYTVSRTTAAPHAGGAAAGAAAAAAAAAVAAAAPATYVFKLAARHALSPPASLPHSGESRQGSSSIATITLHKLLRALSVLWSDGTLQMLQFSQSTASWYASVPALTLTRRLDRFLPDGESFSSSSGGGAGLAATSFALEPSCLVIAGRVSHSTSPLSSRGSSDPAAEDGEEQAGGGLDIGLSVWDVRYGIMLGSKRLPGAGSATPPPAADAVKQQQQRRRKGEGAPSAAAAAATAPGPPSSGNGVTQITVSEDNGYIATVSQSRVTLTAVAARGASLLSAVGAMDVTQTMLQQQQQSRPPITAAAAAAAAAAGAAPSSSGGSGVVQPQQHVADLSRALSAAAAAAAGASSTSNEDDGAHRTTGAATALWGNASAQAVGAMALSQAAQSAWLASASADESELSRACGRIRSLECDTSAITAAAAAAAGGDGGSVGAAIMGELQNWELGRGGAAAGAASAGAGAGGVGDGSGGGAGEATTAPAAAATKTSRKRSRAAAAAAGDAVVAAGTADVGASAAAVSGGGAVSAVSGGGASRALPQELCDAALARVIAALGHHRRGVGNDPAQCDESDARRAAAAGAAAAAWDVCPLLDYLISRGAVSVSSHAELIPLLLSSAAAAATTTPAVPTAAAVAPSPAPKPQRGRSKRQHEADDTHAAVVAAAAATNTTAAVATTATPPLSCLLLVESLLRRADDVPERTLIESFKRAIRSLPSAVMAQFGAAEPLSSAVMGGGSGGSRRPLSAGAVPQGGSSSSDSEFSGSSPPKTAAAAAAGLLRFVAAIVSARRSDVFLTASLAPLLLGGGRMNAAGGADEDDIAALLACLARLLKLHGSGSGANFLSGARTLHPALLPPHGAVLDWIRSVLESRVQALMLRIGADSRSGSESGGSGAVLVSLLRDIAAEVAAQTACSAEMELVRGALRHFLARAPLPAPPMSSHVIERVVL